jgi:splicing factor 1
MALVDYYIAGNQVQERGRERRPKTRTRWQPPPEHFASSLSAVPKYLPTGLTIEQQEALAIRIRIEELTRKIAIGDVDMEFYKEREPSPEPIYDNHGKRLNTKDLRAKDKLIEERQHLVEAAFTMNPQFKPPADYSPSFIKRYRKIYIPVDKFPDYNFIGLIIGPRGNTQKRMEKETGCKIAIRGKGSVKEGRGKRDGQGQGAPDENDQLHVLLTADNDVQLDKASKVINDLLVPVDEGQNEHKRQQLRELAEINGTLRDRMWMSHPLDSLGPSFERAQVKCEICGDASHPTSDCAFKGKNVPLPPAQKEAMASEYEKFLNEIGGGEAKSDVYDEFMAAIGGNPANKDTSAQPTDAPWPQPFENPVIPPWQQPGAAAAPPWAQQAGAAPWQQYGMAPPPFGMAPPPWQQQQPPQQ